MRNLLFVALVFSAPLWAKDDVEKPVNSKAKKCEASLVEASDEKALQARAIGTLLPMGEIRNYLEELTGVKPLPSGFRLETRHTSSRRAISRMMLIEYVKRMGYTVKVGDFGHGANLVVELPGRTLDHEVVEITAHYDSVVTGGDDNGSGVALMLGMLDLFRQTQHERRIRFVFMDLEEQGMQGSNAHAGNIAKSPEEKAKLVGALVVDTIGWAHAESKTFLGVLELGQKHDGPESYDKRMVFGRELMYAVLRGGATDGLIISPETFKAMPGTTDLGAYFRHDLPAALLAAPYEDGFINPGYHKKSDTVENINWDYYRRMAEVATQMLAYVSRMNLKDNKVVNDRGWEVLREQEDRSVSLAAFKLPESADRDVSLAQEHRGSRWGYDNFNSPEEDRGFDPPFLTNRPAKKKSAGKYDKYPLYVARFVETIERTKIGNVYMIVMPSKLAADASGNNPEKMNRGFVWANGEILDLINDSDEVYDLMKVKVLEQGGLIFDITSTDPDFEPSPADLWHAIRGQISRDQNEFTVKNSPLGAITVRRSLEAPKAKKEKKPRKPRKKKQNKDATIWREE